MSRVEKGKKVTLTYQEKGQTGRPTLIVDVAADDDVLPHEHREDMRQAAAAALGVDLKSLEGVEIELKKTGGDHSHPGDEKGHSHPEPIDIKVAPKPIVLPPRQKA